MRQAPSLAERRRIRTRARLSLAKLGRAVGVTGNAIWQYETRVEQLPVTDNTVRYVRLLADLNTSSEPTIAPQK